MLELITDRTALDVARWQELKSKPFSAMTAEEKAEWLRPSKGAYNYTDLNRVNAAMEYLGGIMNDMGYRVSLHPCREWTAADIPTAADVSQYVQNIQMIRQALYMFETLPAAPASMVNFTHTQANDIEKILVDAEVLLDKIPSAYMYSGEVYGGENW